MKAATQTITLSTRGNGHVTDITPHVADAIAAAGIADGIVTVFVAGSTGAITTVEHEPGLVADLGELFERLAPAGARYHHDDTWHDGNGHSHVRASLVGPSLTVPVRDGRLTLGTWQQIVFVDFDTRPRRRELVAQCLGE
jgi:secondary thiamine-phosphate synthase enzyme